MEQQTDIIIYFIKMFIMNLLVYYCFMKITNSNNKRVKIISLVIVTDVILVGICTYLEFFIDSLISLLIMFIFYGVCLGLIKKMKLCYSLIITLISYAICTICLIFSAILTYIPYRLFYEIFSIENNYLNTLMVLTVQTILVCGFFRIKRFKKGFNFINDKLNSDITDIIIINVSTIVILIYCLLGTMYDEITRNLLVTFVIISVIMIATIRKTLTMYYKQKLQKETLKYYEEELAEKNNEIQNLKNEKFNISKITHEFYNRQKALELLVKQNITPNNNISEISASKNVLNIIKSLTEEYSEEFNTIKELPKLETTGIPEIDSMFKYMQNECNKNNIEFKLKIIGNIHPLINNIIPKNKLETLIGDHIRDAINAVNAINTENKEILVILGIKNKKYELAIHDTGIDFTIETLLKLGKEAVTTNSNNGGSGIGFLTTFETLKQTKASLIITEQNPNKERYYSKSIIIRFDGKNQYKIRSYRAFEIKKHRNKENIIIEKI